MRLIIAGSRTVPDNPAGMHILEQAIRNSGEQGRFTDRAISEVVSGGARGADKVGERWAKEHDIPVRVIPALWGLHGRSAGYRRNEEMARYAMGYGSDGGLIALWDGQSPGTRHMIEVAGREGLEVWVEIVKP